MKNFTAEHTIKVQQKKRQLKRKKGHDSMKETKSCRSMKRV